MLEILLAVAVVLQALILVSLWLRPAQHGDGPSAANVVEVHNHIVMPEIVERDEADWWKRDQDDDD